jgi:hypothetical protein
VARLFGGSLEGLPAAVLEAEREARLLAMDAPVLCDVHEQTRDKATGAVQNWRYCIDLREVNAWPQAESYHMPDIRKCLDRLVGNRIFGSIDCSVMYHQIMLSECSKNFIAFCVPGTLRGAGKGKLGLGRWRAERVQFGMKNACQHDLPRSWQGSHRRLAPGRARGLGSIPSSGKVSAIVMGMGFAFAPSICFSVLLLSVWCMRLSNYSINRAEAKGVTRRL